MQRRWAHSAGTRWTKWENPIVMAEPMWLTRVLFWVACFEASAAVTLLAGRSSAIVRDLPGVGWSGTALAAILVIAIVFVFTHAATED